MSSWSLKAGIAGIVIVAATAYAVAQMPDHARMHGMTGNPDQQQMMQPGAMRDQMMQHRMMMGGEATGQPVMPGQEAFGTIQEIVRMLEADPKTDWSKVNISALREHLIDMDEVTMRASATQRSLDNGIEIAVTGEGRTLDGIKRMVPTHVHELSQLGWNAKTEDLSNGGEANGHQHRCQGNHKAQGSRLYGHHGAGGASSTTPPHDGEERVQSLAELNNSLVK